VFLQRYNVHEEKTYMGEEGTQKATRSTTQTRHKVVQNNLRNVVGGSAMAGDLFASLKATQLWAQMLAENIQTD